MLATFAASKIHNFNLSGSIGIHSATLATSGGVGNSAKNSGIHHPATLATSGFGNSANKNSGIHPATATSGFVKTHSAKELWNLPNNRNKWIWIKPHHSAMNSAT
jgi:hypothetical protein